MRLCWADKLGIVWAAIVFGVLATIGAFSADVDAAHNAQQAALVLVLPPWALLRAVDWVIGGPAKRR